MNATSHPSHSCRSSRSSRPAPGAMPSSRERKLAYMADYNARDDVKRRAQEREQTDRYKATRKLYRDKKRALKLGLTPSQIAARVELGLDLMS